MGRLLNVLSLMTLIATAANAADLSSAAAVASHRAGIDVAGMDHAVRAQDDFYAYANGHWLAHTVIPPDKSQSSVLT
ncbi:MAG TPA: hypothetical protein VGI35_05645, partial [Steroidobacteraceae bacterium]